MKAIMRPLETIDLNIINKDAIKSKILETYRRYKNIVIIGEEGVGKITNTVETLQDSGNIYYIGNPVDYIGKPRPTGYDNYINYIISLKKNLHIFPGEDEILSLDLSVLKAVGAVVIIDEIYGRTEKQYRKILEILALESVKVFLITGCLKNAGKIIHGIDVVLMLTKDGAISFDKEFAQQLCAIFKSEML